MEQTEVVQLSGIVQAVIDSLTETQNPLKVSLMYKHLKTLDEFCARHTPDPVAAQLVRVGDVLFKKCEKPFDDLTVLRLAANMNLVSLTRVLVCLIKMNKLDEASSERVYNLKAPVLSANSAEMVEIFLSARFRDLQVAWGDTYLLHECIYKGIANETIVGRLMHQADCRLNGTTTALELAWDKGRDAPFLALYERGGKELPPFYLNLFSQSGNEDDRCRIFSAVVQDHKDLLLANRVRLVRETVRGGHPRLLKHIVETLSVEWKDFQSENLDLPSPLWVAVNSADEAMIRALLLIKGTGEAAAAALQREPDGTTACDLAVALGHDRILNMLLQPISSEVDASNLVRAVLSLRAFADPHLEAKRLRLQSALSDLEYFSPEFVAEGPDDPDHDIVRTSLIYPYYEESSESEWASTEELWSPMMRFLHEDTFEVRTVEAFFMSEICMTSPEDTWAVSEDIQFGKCSHTGFKSVKCALAKDLIAFVVTLEGRLKDKSKEELVVSPRLRPRLTLVGSAAEGTRVGPPNEIDLSMAFEGWKEAPFKVMADDPFHLYAKAFPAKWMKKYFRGKKFDFHAFMRDLLHDVRLCVDDIFAEKANPPSLEIVTSNADFGKNCEVCREKARRIDDGEEPLAVLQQCSKCAVAVSQTKSGICLQFQWRTTQRFLRNMPQNQENFNMFDLCQPLKGPVYCSIDLVPTFKIKKVGAIELARAVNGVMLGDGRPDQAWFRYLNNYAKSDMVLSDIVDYAGMTLNSVTLKVLGCDKERNYHVRPGQPLGQKKFAGDNLRRVYCMIKALKKIFGADGLSTFMVKKILMTPRFSGMDYDDESPPSILAKLLSMPTVMCHFEDDIDFERWDSQLFKQVLPLKKRMDPPADEYRYLL